MSDGNNVIELRPRRQTIEADNKWRHEISVRDGKLVLSLYPPDRPLDVIAIRLNPFAALNLSLDLLAKVATSKAIVFEEYARTIRAALDEVDARKNDP